jgi:hypothetical protein
VEKVSFELSAGFDGINALRISRPWATADLGGNHSSQNLDQLFDYLCQFFHLFSSSSLAIWTFFSLIWFICSSLVLIYNQSYYYIARAALHVFRAYMV